MEHFRDANTSELRRCDWKRGMVHRILFTTGLPSLF